MRTRKLKEIFFLSVITILFTGCVDYNDASQGVSLEVTIEKPTTLSGDLNLSGHTVVATTNTGYTVQGVTDSNGVARFVNLIPEVYSIATSWEISSSEYSQATQTTSNLGGAIISGSTNSITLFENAQVSLSTNIVETSIVIGKIYYAGSKDVNNRNYIAGKYIEIYNPSASTIDLSGLYIGIIESENTPAYTEENRIEQFADSVVLFKQIFQIPATSNTLIPSGGTILIANSAIDHSANGTYEPDLSGADFEAKDASGGTVNNPDVEALSLVYTAYPRVSNFNLLSGGPSGVAIFATSEDVSTFPKVYKYGTTRGTQWVVVPKRHIIDGVDIVKNKATGASLSDKRLPTDIDGGITYVNSVSGYTGEVIVRKVRRQENGRTLLEDTNNSSNDFVASTTAKIRVYED